MFCGNKWGFSAITVMPYSLFLSLSTPRVEKGALSVPTLILLLLALQYFSVDVLCGASGRRREAGRAFTWRIAHLKAQLMRKNTFSSTETF